MLQRKSNVSVKGVDENIIQGLCSAKSQNMRPSVSSKLYNKAALQKETGLHQCPTFYQYYFN